MIKKIIIVTLVVIATLGTIVLISFGAILIFNCDREQAGFRNILSPCNIISITERVQQHGLE